MIDARFLGLTANQLGRIAITGLKAENEKLRKLVIAYADSFETNAALNNGEGPYYSGEDWLGLANDMRLELAECCGELEVEVD